MASTHFSDLTPEIQVQIKEKYIFTGLEKNLFIDSYNRPYEQTTKGRLMLSIRPQNLIDGGFHKR